MTNRPDHRITDVPRTLWELVSRRAELTPDEVMVDDEQGRSLTFAQYRDAAERVAAGLSAHGVGSGTMVSWQLPSTIESVVLVAALTRLDAAQNPIIPILREREVTYITREAATDLLIAPSTLRGFDYHAMLAPIAKDHGFAILECDHGGLGQGELALPTGDPSTLRPPTTLGADDELPARWLYHTSGSTADPKGVWHSDASVIAGSSGWIQGIAPTGDEVVPVPFPFTHIGGMCMLGAVLRVGHRLVLIEAFDAQRSPLVMAEHGATILGSALPFFQAYLAAQRAHGPVPLWPDLRAGVNGGAPNSPELHREVQEVLGGRGVLSSWGLTEFPIASSGAIDDPDDLLVSTEGRAAPDVEVRVRNPADGSDCPPDEPGELCLRGPQMFLRYANADLMPDAFDERGYFRTGDLGIVLPSGHVRITGRLKDVVIRNAENISATEVEDVLHGHPKIADVAVIGVPDPRTVERVCAIVRLADGVDSITVQDLAEYCIGIGLAKQKIPERVEVVDEIPRNPMGKIRKQELRDRFAS
jgi:cyclohexanecarboxylate-CoA ligase